MSLRPIHAVIAAYVLLAAATIVLCDGTGDSGDSVNHYLFARYAPRHPALFFDHWAKPLFVLLACPFAQFGFTGMKVFNAIVTGATLLLTHRTAARLGSDRPWIAPLFLLVSPVYFALTFSGLTEPLFALMLCLAVVLALEDRPAWSLVVVSFLPFVRSEGLIMAGVFTAFHMLRGSWRNLPFLLMGTVIYSIAGWPVHHDLLWTFTRIPYASWTSPYGHGRPLHFVEDLVMIIGLPVYALFWAGCAGLLAALFRKKDRGGPELLIPALLWAFIIAHSLFWYFGMFNSMGLVRVLVGIAPLASLIAMRGLHAITRFVGGRWPQGAFVFTWACVLYAAIFPFTPNPAALNIDHDLMLRPDQTAALDLVGSFRKSMPAPTRIIAAHPYLGLALNVDRFDTAQWLDPTPTVLAHLRPGDAVIWDNGFALHERGVRETDLSGRSDLELLDERNATNMGKEVRYTIFVKR